MAVDVRLGMTIILIVTCKLRGAHLSVYYRVAQ